MSNATVSRNILIGIIVTLVLVVIGELVWAGMILSQKPTTTVVTTDPTPLPSVEPKVAALMLQADKKELVVGEAVTFTISVSSTDPVSGVDAIVSFDPKLFTVDKTSTTSATVKVGTLLDTYQENKIDEKTGTVVVSGITQDMEGKLIDGVLGTFTLKAKAKGTARLDFLYSTGGTSDSNVVEPGTGADILQQVQGTELVIK